MHIDQQVDDAHRIVFLTLAGKLSDKDLLGLADLIENTPGYGMARMYELLRGEGGMRVFRDDDEARRWIGAGTGSSPS